MEKLKLPLWKPFKREVVNGFCCIPAYYAVSLGSQVFDTQLSKHCRLVTLFLIYCRHDHNTPYTNHTVISGEESNVFGCTSTSLRDYYICKLSDLSVTVLFWFF